MAAGDVTSTETTHSGHFAAVFDGTNDYMESDLAAPFITSNCSISLWVYRDNVANEKGICGKWNNGEGGYLISLGAAANVLNIYVRTAAGRSRTTITPFTYKTWHHVVTTWDGTTLKAYLDGSDAGAVVESDASGAIKVTSEKFTIGEDSAANKHHDGAISDVRVFDTTLSATDVTTLYNGGDVSDGLVAHYKLNDLIDSVGTNDLTNNGAYFAYVDSAVAGDVESARNGASDKYLLIPIGKQKTLLNLANIEE